MPWPTFNPGALRHQIAILKQTYGEDESGTSVEYVPLLYTYAAIETTSTGSSDSDGQNVAQVGLKVTIRWQSGIDPSMRVQARNGNYEIQAIENVEEMDTWLVLTCQALSANQ
jgi:head-tail adaptor